MDKLQKALGLARMISLPPNIIEGNNVKAQACIWVEHCPFFRLVFEPLWAGQITSHKHVYHVWCAHAHFSLSIKCIDILCGQDMHIFLTCNLCAYFSFLFQLYEA